MQAAGWDWNGGELWLWVKHRLGAGGTSPWALGDGAARRGGVDSGRQASSWGQWAPGRVPGRRETDVCVEKELGGYREEGLEELRGSMDHWASHRAGLRVRWESAAPSGSAEALGWE